MLVNKNSCNIIKYLICFIVLCCYTVEYSYGQNIAFAMTSEYRCGEFFNGIATIKEYEKSKEKYYFINRKGERIGKAPGMMLWADQNNKIFENSRGAFLANANNKKISKNYFSRLEYLCPGFFKGAYIAKNKGKVECIVSCSGKTILDPKVDIISTNYREGSPFVEFEYNEDTEYLNFIYKGENLVMADQHIEEETLSSAYPIIVGKNNIYNKQTGKMTKLPQNYFKKQFLPFVNFYIVDGKYFDLAGNPISKGRISTSSKGISMREVGKKQYALFNRNGYRINQEIYEDVDPFYWQSDVIAVSKNGKWGYLNSDGIALTSFVFDKASTCVYGWIIVVEENKYTENESCAIINLWKQHYEKLINSHLNSYYFDKIDGDLVLFYKHSSDNGGYGYKNLTNGVGWSDLRGYPQFKNGIADNISNQVVFLKNQNRVNIPGDDNVIVKNIGEGLFKATVYTDDGYASKIYDSRGNLLFDGSASRVTIQGCFECGVAPVFVFGGLDDRKMYGYIYNTFSSSKGRVLASYGNMGQNTESANDFIAQRVQYLDYYQLLGNNALRENRFEDAIYHYDRALKLYSSFDEAQFGKGIALMHLEKYEEAYWVLPVGNIPGNAFAKTVCSYKTNRMSEALKYSKDVPISDPGYEDAQEIRRWAQEGIAAKKARIEAERERKHQRTMAILNAITTGLNLFSQTVTAINNVKNGYSAPVQTYTPVFNKSKSTYTPKEKSCSFCKGTGMNPGKEYPPNYGVGVTESDFSNRACDVCGSYDNHYHKPCPSCGGKGYQISAY